MRISSDDIRVMDKIKRLNLINSITGIKPANLIGTISEDNVSNLAVFSSVVHLGSNPPLIGMISRPDKEVPRHTLENIKSHGYYSINHLPIHLTKNGHYTSAKFPAGVSEFDKCGFTEEYVAEYKVPLVKESNIKMILKHKEYIKIETNGTIMIIGEVVELMLADGLMNEEGILDLEQASTAGISGLNSYYKLQKIATYPYARVNELPDFVNGSSGKAS